MRKIIHVDMDAFYASVEQRDNPALRGFPVAVGHGAKRGVVAAASYEARAFGVRSAMPSTTAMRQCPELVFVPPRFDVYRAVSRQIHAILVEYTPLIEPLSLDEAYLDVTENRRGLPSASATAKEIRARILQETSLTASAGVSYNKFLAKLASGQRKPNGQFVITPDDDRLHDVAGEHEDMRKTAGMRPCDRAARGRAALAGTRRLMADRALLVRRRFRRDRDLDQIAVRVTEPEPVRLRLR